MIFSFYGYKGGVGRTVALVHAASLLVSTRARGVKILVIDLDIEAPGSIEALLPPADKNAPPPKRGFCDLLQDYLDGEDRDVEWIRKRLEDDTYAAAQSLFVFGTGTRERAKFLQATRLLQEAYDDKFFDKLRTACESFDYVLVDSRTGLADIATAATILLGDVLVACFRPSHANLGVAEIVRHFLAYHGWQKDDPAARVIPLLTPRPAQYSEDSQVWSRIFRDEIFGPHLPIISIPFDPILQVGERLLIPPHSVTLNTYEGGIKSLRAASNIDVDAPILSAYTELMDRMAAFNVDRDIIAAQQVETRELAAARFVEVKEHWAGHYLAALETLLGIIRREPNAGEHWMSLLNRYEAFVLEDRTGYKTCRAFLDHFLQSRANDRGLGCAWAHMLRARLFGPSLEDRGAADCVKAIELAEPAASAEPGLLALARYTKMMTDRSWLSDPAHEDIRLENPKEAIVRQLDAAIAAIHGERPSAQVYIARGDALRDLHRYDAAIESYEKAAANAEAPGQALIAAGRVFEWTNRYGEALQRYLAAADHTHDREMFRRLIYLLASLGHTDAALELAGQWRALTAPRNDPEPFVAQVIVHLVEGKVEQVARVIQEMEERRLPISRTFRVAQAIRQGHFDHAALIAEEDHRDARPFLRTLARLATGGDAQGVTLATDNPRELPALALAQFLAGNPDVEATLQRARRQRTAQSAKWSHIAELTQALADAGRGLNDRLDEFLKRTTKNPDTAIFLRNQLELRLAWNVCQNTPQGTVLPLVAKAFRSVFSTWDELHQRPLDSYSPFRFQQRRHTDADVTSVAITA